MSEKIFPNKEDVTKFFENSDPKIIINQIYSHPSIKMFLEFNRTFEKGKTTGKTRYDFFIKIKDEDGKITIFYENEKKNNFSLSIKRFFQKLKNTKHYKEISNNKDEKSQIVGNISENIKKDFGFLINDLDTDISLYKDKTSFSNEEIDNFLQKELNSKNKDDLIELKEDLSSFKNKILSNKELLNEEEYSNFLSTEVFKYNDVVPIKKEINILKNLLEEEKDFDKIEEIIKKIDLLKDKIENVKLMKNKFQDFYAYQTKINFFTGKIDKKQKFTKEELENFEDILELALKDRGRISTFEKIYVNKARELVIRMNLNTVVLNNQWIKEFKDRTFGTLDFDRDRLIITESDCKIANCGIRKNIYKLIELEIKGKASKTARFELDSIKNELGWNEVEMISHVYTKLLESVYFYRPENQSKSVQFDTFLISSIKKIMQDLKNYSIKTDKYGGRKERQKDDLIKAKIKKYQYELEKENQEYNLENLWKKCEVHNNETTTFKIKKEDVEKMMFNLDNSYVSFDNMLTGDDGSEGINDVLNAQLWEENGANTTYDPYYLTTEKIKIEKTTEKFSELANSIEEQIVLEIWLENFQESKSAGLNVEKFQFVEKVNNCYSSFTKSIEQKSNLTKEESSQQKEINELKSLTVEDIKDVCEKLMGKIKQNQDSFMMLMNLSTNNKKK